MTRFWGGVLVIMVVFCTGAWAHGRVLPILEGGDEWLQLAYMEHLRATGTLPPRNFDSTGAIRQQSGQPPLTYALSALAPAALRLPPLTETDAMMDALQRDSNNWFAPPNRFNRRDNNNVFYRSNVPANTPAVIDVVRAVRWVAPLYGVLAIAAMAGAAREVFGCGRWALAATAFFAFTPMFLHVNSFLTTDAGAAALGTVVLWLALVIARRGTTWWRSVAVGLALGLAGLAKVSTLLLAPAVGAAVMLGVWANRGVVRVVGHGVLIAVPLALTFGVWAGWGWLTYGDPLGTQTHQFPGQHFDPPLGVGAVLARMPEVYLSYWGKFASAVYLHPATYAALTGLVAVAGVGYVIHLAWGVRATDESPTQQHGSPLRHPSVRMSVVIALAAGTLFAGVWYWVATINFITGRLMFPAHGAFALIVTGGFYVLAKRFPRADFALRALLVAPTAVVGLVVAPLALHAAYAPPPPASGVAADEGVVAAAYTFEQTVHLMGWHAPTSTITSGELFPVKLCWRVLQPTQRPAAYSLKIVQDGVPVGERTSVHGLGRYDWRQWQEDDAFCETVDVPIGDVEPNAAYDIILVMLDAYTGAVDWQATAPDGTPVAFPWLGQVRGAS